MTLSVWIPLTRATPHNGCMYVVPAPYAPASGKDIRPRDIRCLPAEPGDVLSWRQDLFHWGGRSSERARQPRIALGLELQGRTQHAFDRPLYRPGHVPSLDHRLALVGQNLWRYPRTPEEQGDQGAVAAPHGRGTRAGEHRHRPAQAPSRDEGRAALALMIA